MGICQTSAELNSGYKDCFARNIDVAALGIATVTINTDPDSGYVPSGILLSRLDNSANGGANSSFCNIYNQQISGNNIICIVKNLYASGAAKVDVGVRVQYKRQ